MIKDQFDDCGFHIGIYTLPGQENRNKDSKLQLQEINKDLLSVEGAKELEERRADLEQLLYNLKIKVNCLVGTKEESPSPIVSRV